MENTSDTFHVAQETQKLDRTERNGHKTSYCYLEIVVTFWILKYMAHYIQLVDLRSSGQ